MTATISLIFDLIMMAALAATIWHARRLSRQFAEMQADRRAFEALIQSLNIAASRAEGAIRNLKDAAGQSGDALQDKINAARQLEGELEIMLQAGDSLADRLGDLAEQGRKSAPLSAAAGTSAPQDRAGKDPRTRAEKELLEALKAKQQS